MSALPRSVEAEWLDMLPAGDLRAVRARRDLRRVNWCMAQAAIMAGLLLRAGAGMQPRTILDLGSGDGTFMARVAARMATHWPRVHVVLVDRQDLVTEHTRGRFARLGWTATTLTGDVFEVLEQRQSPAPDVVTANLFLHHFESGRAAQLLALAAPQALFAACEPARTGAALVASKALWAIGCNEVTRHDAAASVRAGFRGSELSELWPERAGWTLTERGALPFTHCFAARRHERVAGVV